MRLIALSLLFLISVHVLSAQVRGPEGWLVTVDFPVTATVQEHPRQPQIEYVAEAKVHKDGITFSITRMVPIPKGAPDDLYHMYETMKQFALISRPSRLVEDARITIGG